MRNIFKNFFNKAAYKSLSKDHGWNAPSSSTANRTLLPHLTELQDQSSELVRNEAVGSMILNNLELGSIGSGLKPNSSPDFEILGIKEVEASKWASKAEKLFSLWANSKECTLSKDMTFNELEKLVFRSTLEFGDTVVLRREKKDSHFPLCLQAFEGNRLGTPIEKEGNENIKEGVEISPITGETKAFYLRNKETELDEFTYKKIKKLDDEGNTQATIIKNTKRLSQNRGEPLLTVVSPLIRVLGKYVKGELDISALSSYISFIVKSSDGSSVLPDHGVVGYGDDNKTQTPTATDLKPRSVISLNPGEDLSLLDPKRPNSSFQAFVDHIIGLIAAEVGLPAEALLSKFTSSYSASRASLLIAQRTYKSKREWIVNGLHNQVWAWFIESCVAKGHLNAPGFFENELIKQAYLSVTFTGSGCLQIDSAKEAQGMQALYDLGVTSKQEICKTMGINYDTIISQRLKENENDGTTEEQTNGNGKESTGKPDEVIS